MAPSTVLLLPGWHNSGPDHWQTRWEQAHGYQRVEQHDWERPLRGDWIARIEEVVLGCAGQVVLVAHSLGCIAVAAWAAHSRNTQRVHAALLVVPPDTETPALREALPGWSPIPLLALPFPSVLVASSDDPYCTPPRSQHLATAWQSRAVSVGRAGHLNAASGLGDWPAGHALLTDLLKD
ncbi:MAG: alpha/beta hydrolase [Pseudomonadota bacterium]